MLLHKLGPNKDFSLEFERSGDTVPVGPEHREAHIGSSTGRDLGSESRQLVGRRPCRGQRIAPRNLDVDMTDIDELLRRKGVADSVVRLVQDRGELPSRGVRGRGRREFRAGFDRMASQA